MRSAKVSMGRRDLTAFAGMTGRVDSWTHLALVGPVYSYGRGWKWGHPGLVWHSAHSYALGQHEATLASVGLVRSGQEWRNF